MQVLDKCMFTFKKTKQKKTIQFIQFVSTMLLNSHKTSFKSLRERVIQKETAEGSIGLRNMYRYMF